MSTKKPKPRISCHNHVILLIFTSFLVSAMVYFNSFSIEFISKSRVSEDECLGKYIYIHDLPEKFNYGLLKECETLHRTKNMCVYIQNDGLGPPIFNKSTGVEGSWFATDQFMLEVIFHSRMKQYKCLTENSLVANGFYVPFYAGLEASRTIRARDTRVRDEAGIEVMKYVSRLKEWEALEGRDHFFVAGRIGKDFSRGRNSTYWGNALMSLPESKHITMLTIEASSGGLQNEVAIPYPTYFHPSSFKEILQWQRAVSSRKRKHLFAFAGASRRRSIRNHLIAQCTAAGQKCGLLSCENALDQRCQSPLRVLKLFRNSIFCLQPAGDSPTRRSTFDSIISGCIPVFFSLQSGPEQYLWYFPGNYTEYSVYIPNADVRRNKADIMEILSGISLKKVEAMRSKVIEMIPRVVYRNPLIGKTAETSEEEDAFDIAVQGLLRRVEINKRKFFGRRNQLFIG